MKIRLRVGIWEGQDHDIPINKGVFKDWKEAEAAEEVYGPFDYVEFISAYDGIYHDKFIPSIVRGFKDSKLVFDLDGNRYGYWESPRTGIWYAAVGVSE
jgi:hypothetical protein